MARIGCVPYLNALPLLEGITHHVRKDVPSKLWKAFLAGEFDAALVSSVDVFLQKNPAVVDGVSIHSKGDVYSVVLCHSGDLREISKVHLDPASHTSNALIRIILEEFHGLKPIYVQNESETAFSLPVEPGSSKAHLLIGDAAIQARGRVASKGTTFLDLGEEWYRNTGLPFVFAVWILAREFTEKKEIANDLRSSRNLGVHRISSIAAKWEDPAFAEEYMTRYIQYGLGVDEKRGLALFADYLKSMNYEKFMNAKISYY